MTLRLTDYINPLPSPARINQLSLNEVLGALVIPRAAIFAAITLTLSNLSDFNHSEYDLAALTPEQAAHAAGEYEADYSEFGFGKKVMNFGLHRSALNHVVGE
ncbi:hypothetical protein HOD30_02835 [Candidatus Peregrinibacteria bacterium]|jgi:hypothetical protein|nr:hypothetical protein [Candidatus Peregrinibacteria bacterium]MBT4631519.1 hypothetical protein [Candidatus Peregrinibacteria bacterium]MBT5516986.1 hypothetical protein [Candidatus Peregrinibacteria bacterium]